MAGGGVAWEVDAGVPSWGRLQGLMRIDPRERETRFREGRSIHPAMGRTEEVAGVAGVVDEVHEAYAAATLTSLRGATMQRVDNTLKFTEDTPKAQAMVGEVRGWFNALAAACPGRVVVARPG